MQKCVHIISRSNAKSLGMKHYFTGKECKRGHVSERTVSGKHCTTCRHYYSQEYNPEYQKRYRAQAWYKEYNRRKQKETSKKKQRKQYMKEYSRKEHVKEYHREYRKNKRKADKRFAASLAIRSMLKRLSRSAANGSVGISSRNIGYSSEDLAKRMEYLFLPGMSWDNYGEWHIDHREPVSSFIKRGELDPRVINALENLYPMWACHNASKGSKNMSEWIEENPDMKLLYGHFLD